MLNPALNTPHYSSRVDRRRNVNEMCSAHKARGLIGTSQPYVNITYRAIEA